MATDIRRRTLAGAALGIGIIAVAAVLWLRDGGSPVAAPPAGIVAITPVQPPPPSSQAPAAPALPNTIAGTPDMFVGSWRSSGGGRLTIARAGPEGYAVTLANGASSEAYDGVLQDGRIQIARGIDGDWIQLQEGDKPCLVLGSGERFCRS